MTPDEGHAIADRYELAGTLGGSASAVVYRARDLLSGDEVAVKVFRHAALQNSAALKAYKRDLAVLRDHVHPNVVRILDFGETAGAFYVAMELIRGEPLSRRDPHLPGWPYDALLELMEQVTSGLASLHAHGIVHGDVRTSNIVRHEGAITLMDFGPQRDSRQVTVHAPDSTWPYASPERLMGRPLTAASDVYSAAAVVYDLLVGEPPHARASLADRATAQLPCLRGLVPGAPEILLGVLERCLNPDPTLRPADAAGIAEECRGGRREAELPSLAARIGGVPLDISETVALLLAICRDVKCIHDAGKAHPELSPRNIRFTCGGEVSIDSYPAPPANATLLLTEPKYAAPEMLLTHTTAGGVVHIRSDIYVLGFVAYEAIAGGDAFRRQLFKEQDAPDSELFWMKWHSDKTASLLPLADVNPSVPQELCALVHRMIEKDPDARPSSLDEVASELTQLQRRLETTGDIDLASISCLDEEETPDSPVLKQVRKVLLHVLLITVLLASAGAVWMSKARLEQFLHRVAGTPPPPAPAATLETATGPMVLVPGGRFVVGSSAVPNESPAHTIYLAAFYIDKYEVSNGRYRAFTDSTGYSQPPAPSWDPDYFAKNSYPVLNVSWRDAQAFCAAAGKRLPAEAEWETAARGASPSSRFWANWTVSGLANVKNAGTGLPVPGGQFAADVSPFGVHDMAGNVHEWVNDRYSLYEGNPASLDGADVAKVVRGGSFAFSPPGLSPSWRASLNPSITPGSDSPVGFRCAADPSLGVSRSRVQSPQ